MRQAPRSSTDASPMTSVPVSLDSGGLVSNALGRVGLVRNGSLRVGRASAIVVVVTWLPLLILTAIDGTLLGGVEVPFLRDPAVHARLRCRLTVAGFNSDTLKWPDICDLARQVRLIGRVPDPAPLAFRLPPHYATLESSV